MASTLSSGRKINNEKRRKGGENFEEGKGKSSLDLLFIKEEGGSGCTRLREKNLPGRRGRCRGKGILVPDSTFLPKN